MKKATIGWASEKWPGTEFFRVTRADNGYYCEGYLTGVLTAQPFAIEYKVTLNEHWLVTAAHIRSLENPRQVISLHHNGQGSWEDASGKLIPSLQGCLDIDISLTPFTNTLPIRRLSWQQGVAQTIHVVYLNLPEFTCSPMQQRYTPLRKGVFLYENVTDDYSAELHVDEEGLVINYPDAFTRVFMEVEKD